VNGDDAFAGADEGRIVAAIRYPVDTINEFLNVVALLLKLRTAKVCRLELLRRWLVVLPVRFWKAMLFYCVEVSIFAHSNFSYFSGSLLVILLVCCPRGGKA